MKKSQKEIQKEWYKGWRARCSLSLVDRNNEMHLNRLKGLLENKIVNGPVLEIGCSGGWYDGRLSQQTYLADISEEGIKKTKRSVVADAERLPFKDRSFGLVYGFGIIHHLQDMDQGLKEAYRVLRPEGLIAFGAENSALCPANYLLPFIYGNWKVEKGFRRILKGKIERTLSKIGFRGFHCCYGNFTIYGMRETVYRITRKMEDILSFFPPLLRFAGFIYFTAKKP